MSVYYLSSLDSSRFEQVRRCDVVRTASFETGKTALVVELHPPVIGQDLGFGEDLSRFVVTARFEGDDVSQIDSFPFFVYICLPRAGRPGLPEPLRAADLDVVAWGELYRTGEDAAAHTFDS